LQYLATLLPVEFSVHFILSQTFSFPFFAVYNSFYSRVASSVGALPCAWRHRTGWPASLRLHTDRMMRQPTRRAYVSPQDGICKSLQERASDRSCSKTKHASFRRKANAAPRRALELHSAPPWDSGGFRNYKPLNWNSASSWLCDRPVSWSVSLWRKRLILVFRLSKSLKTTFNIAIHKDSVLIALWTHSVWVTETSQLMLYREIITVCSEIHKNQIAVGIT
jgi:hypothetical protein